MRPADKPLTVLFAGRCEPRKGLHYAMKAWVESGIGDRGGRFLICGEYVDGYREVLAQWLAHPSVEDLGYVGDLSGLMREADIFILPSVEEGSALVTYEAQASGCVLVVSDATGARCEHMETGLVHAARDVDALTAHLRLLRGGADAARASARRDAGPSRRAHLGSLGGAAGRRVRRGPGRRRSIAGRRSGVSPGRPRRKSTCPPLS